jgi:serine/threonine protein kinase
MKIRCGTFGYTAPEVANQVFVDQSIDIWSFGLCLYQMAVAYLPPAIKQYRYGTGPIPFRRVDWTSFNFEKLKDLIESCLQIKPENRISAKDAINHPWFELD